jgi:hypothetical protein
VRRALLLGLLALAGCGYQDDNPHAAQVMAQALLDAHTAHDANAFCRLLGPALLSAAASQGGGLCQPFVQRTFDSSGGRLNVGSVYGDDKQNNLRGQGRPDITNGGVKYASVWRVESATGLLTPR